MPTENATANRGYQLPSKGNSLAVDVLRIIAAFNAIDVDVADVVAAMATKAGLASPAFSGTPTAPTPTTGDSSGKIATTAFVVAAVDLAVEALLQGAPGALDTLNELAAALGDDPNFSTTVLTALSNRLEKAQNLADLPDKVAARLALGLSYANDAAKLTFQQNIGSLFHGQCRVDLSGGNIVLSRHSGRFLVIDGGLQEIPSAGVTLAPAAGDAVYYIYAYMNSGTMTLERSATAYAVDAATGVTIKTGDATRTLVGMGRIVSSAWTHSASWFNRRWLNKSTAFTAVRSTTSGTFVEINTEIRNGFLVWAGESVNIAYSAVWTCNTSGVALRIVIILNTANLDLGAQDYSLANGITMSNGGAVGVSGLSEGYHYATLQALVNGGASLSFSGDTSPTTAPPRTSISVGTMA